MITMKSSPKIGDVFLVCFDGTGTEQQGLRPALVVQNNIGNQYSPNTIVLPLTSSIKKTSQPTHVFLPADKTGLIRDSLVLCENPKCICKNKLATYLTTLPDIYMKKIAEAYLLATSVISFLSPEVLNTIWERSCSLNRG